MISFPYHIPLCDFFHKKSLTNILIIVTIINMRKTTQGNIQKNITLTPELFHALLDRAKETKLDFQDYVRVLLAASIKSDLPLIDEETEKRIAQAVQDLAQGKYIEVNPHDEKKMNKILEL